MSPRRPLPIDVWCPACGAAPWSKCEGGSTHYRRRAVTRRLARELGFPPVRVLQNAEGQFRAAKR
jgi:hypothetical protein